MRNLILLSIAAITVCAAATVLADVPTSMNIQGRLTDTAGASIGERFMEFGFTIWDAPNGGTLIWSGELQEVYVDLSGLWNARIGAINPLTEAVFSDTSRWLEVTVGDSANLPDTLPRIKLNTTPYTYRSASSQESDDAVLFGGQPPESYAAATHDHELNDLSDVSAETTSEGDLLTWESGQWIASGAPSIGHVFTRWGNPTAPTGSLLLYSGFAYSSFNTSGHTSNTFTVILKGDDAGPLIPPGGLASALYPLRTTPDAEFLPPGISTNEYVQGAVCMADGPTFVLWGSHTPPTGWTALYHGYAMGPHYQSTGGPMGPICVDTNFIGVLGPGASPTILYGTGVDGWPPAGSDLYGRFVKCVVCQKQ